MIQYSNESVEVSIVRRRELSEQLKPFRSAFHISLGNVTHSLRLLRTLYSGYARLWDGLTTESSLNPPLEEQSTKKLGSGETRRGRSSPAVLIGQISRLAQQSAVEVSSEQHRSQACAQ